MRFEFALPDDRAVGGVDADDISSGRFAIGAGDENPIAPEHRRGVAATGESNVPVVIFFAELCGDIGRTADSRAVGAAEARPFLAERGNAEAKEGGSQIAEGRVHKTPA